MPKYIFRGPEGPDSEPIELPDNDYAWAEGVTMFATILKDEDGRLPGGSCWQLQILDEAGEEVGALRLEARRSPSRERP